MIDPIKPEADPLETAGPYPPYRLYPVRSRLDWPLRISAPSDQRRDARRAHQRHRLRA